MRNVIDLCNEDLTRATFKDVMFLSFAEGGAMGTPGEIIFFVKTGELYTLNYVYGDVQLKKVIELFPTLDECKFGMFGIDSTVPEGWNYVNLGMGNHLIVNSIVYDSFIEKIGSDTRPSEKYGRWIDVAEEVVKNI